MEVARIMKDQEPGKIYGLLGNINLITNHNNVGIITPYRFKDTIQSYLNHSKASQALKMVFLNDTYLDKTSSELSEMDLKRISLAKALLENKVYLVLDYFEKDLNNKEKANYKRLFKKLATNYNLTIMMYTNDLTFLWDIVDEILMVDNEQVINKVKKKDVFEIINLVDESPIMNFINLMRAKNINVENYKDVKDLLKAIYRLKDEQK